MKLIVGNKNYSSWSLRGWLAVKQSGLHFEELTVPLYGEDWEEMKRKQGEFQPSGGKVPVLWDGGSAVSYERINEWQRAWARFRTGDSAIDYVRVAGSIADPILLNAGQTQVSVARQVGVSERTVRGIVCEGPLDSADDQAARRPGAVAVARWAAPRCLTRFDPGCET